MIVLFVLIVLLLYFLFGFMGFLINIKLKGYKHFSTDAKDDLTACLGLGIFAFVFSAFGGLLYVIRFPLRGKFENYMNALIHKINP